jgi:diguanylate cyclase (GGDEF)-like protein
MQQTGILLHVPTLADVKVLKPAGADLKSIPITPMDKIMSGYHMQDASQRVRVHGTITYYQPGSAVVLQDGFRSLWITTLDRGPFKIGDTADATGFPDAMNGALVLTHAEIEDSFIQAPIKPQPANWRQLALWNTSQPEGHLYDLVSIEGQVVTEVRGAAQDEYVLVSDGQLFSAVYRHPDPTSHLESLPIKMKEIPLGSSVQVSGICMIEDTRVFTTGETVPFKILLRSFGDIEVVKRASLLNVRNLMLTVCLLLVFVAVVGTRGWTLERKVRRQTSALARIEQRRSRILEDINGSRPLAEILEEIAELATFKLHGAPCWFQVADGALLGNHPPELSSLRIVHQEIPARSGSPLGKVFAAFASLTKPSAIEAETLSTAVGLATLAIETRKLYSDLRHRSEFDLLTDIHNRFSLEIRMDAQIEEARATAGIFGLIYVDLDGFKQVNDLYGHHIGDLYLQGVARRMKQQLRSHDLLARLGGDEFAVLLPMVRNRAGVEEIAQRLEHSFNSPLTLEGQTLQGTASFGIALYPEDSATRDGLLSAADSAMYTAKNARRQAAAEATDGESPVPPGETHA